eukprot:136232-Ditylum_brightwellii.AAC.1
MKMTPIICQVLCYKVAQWCKLPCGTPPRLPMDATAESLPAAVETQVELGWQRVVWLRNGARHRHSIAKTCRINPF